MDQLTKLVSVNDHINNLPSEKGKANSSNYPSFNVIILIFLYSGNVLLHLY